MNLIVPVLPVLALLLSTAGVRCQDPGPAPVPSRGRLLSPVNAEALLGAWVATGEEAERLEFRRGGVLLVDGAEMRYSTQGRRLTIDMEGGSLQGTFDVAGANLKITLLLPAGDSQSESYRREVEVQAPADRPANRGIDRSLTKSYAGDEAGAAALIRAFLDKSTDRVALTKALRPDTADFRAIFAGDAAAKAEAAYAKLWDAGAFEGIGGHEYQTDTVIKSVSTADIAASNEKAGVLPGGYQRVKDKFVNGLVVYRFKFVKPGETIGMAYDGLVHVNGHWVWVPKPWRALRDD